MSHEPKNAAEVFRHFYDRRRADAGSAATAWTELSEDLAAAGLVIVPADLAKGFELLEQVAPVGIDAETRGRIMAAIDRSLAAAFRIGFENAVNGGVEAGGLVPRHAIPLIMYFGNEQDRREMLDAVTMCKPGMVQVKIPDRSK